MDSSISFPERIYAIIYKEKVILFLDYDEALNFSRKCDLEIFGVSSKGGWIDVNTKKTGKIWSFVWTINLILFFRLNLWL